ncbi:unnamed protein product [Mytilus coruscus]|uniref:ISXO2-like transposase domain-containing protein n=1 Tax=Mytilus coruscus TaxID=42192 RepID=A0A6J8D055_MYTCO|nr:unnamed protein product [Mytilus coruscus]
MTSSDSYWDSVLKSAISNGFFQFFENISSPANCLKWMRSNGLLKKAKHCDDCNIWCSQVRQSEKVDHWRILEDTYQLGEDNDDIVAIDESKFGRKRKYAKGSTRDQEGTWVFGMVERKRQRVFVFAAGDRKRVTLQPYIQAHIKSGATVHSDEFSTYFNLKDIDYNHKTVNHSEEFVSAEGIHTNTIEGFWGNSKQHFTQIPGVNRNLLGPHLDEIMYRWNY